MKNELNLIDLSHKPKRILFHDRYNNVCEISTSSMALEKCVWLGLKRAEPKVLAREAALAGVQTDETTGWVDYLVPGVVHINTSMLLTQDQAAALVQTLQKFVDTGEI